MKGISLSGKGTPGDYHLDKASMKLSLSHSKDSLEYNLRHAEEHLQKARENCEALEKSGERSQPPVSKELLSLFDYFEKAIGHDEAEKRFKNHISKNY